MMKVAVKYMVYGIEGRIKHCLLFVFWLILLLLVSNEGLGQTEKSSVKGGESNERSASKPIFKDTGNPERDRVAYEQAKEEWYLKNVGRGERTSGTKQIDHIAGEPRDVPEMNKSKLNFILILNPEAQHRYDDYALALIQFDRLEQFRYMDKRNTLYLANNEGSVELYSANELKELHGRPAHPYNMTDDKKLPQLELVITGQLLVKEQLKK
jgi:hypothetical protein